jgi:hypothetical protein
MHFVCVILRSEINTRVCTVHHLLLHGSFDVIALLTYFLRPLRLGPHTRFAIFHGRLFPQSLVGTLKTAAFARGQKKNS